MDYKINKQLVESFKGQIIILHDLIIKKTGGEPGIRDEGGLYNASTKILKILSKKISVEKKGAYIFEDLAKRHYFFDGNKRTAYGLVRISLIMQGFDWRIDYKKAVNFIIEIAKAKYSKSTEEIEDWIKNNMKKMR